MPTIDPEKISEEILDKYSIVNNAFTLEKVINAELDKIGEPKDKIEFEIGDTILFDTIFCMYNEFF